MLNTGYSESFKFCPLAVHPFNRVLTQSTSVTPPPNPSQLPHWSWIVSDLPNLMIGQGGAYIQTLRKEGSLVSKKTIFQPFWASVFRAEKRSAQASAHSLSQAQGGLFLCVDCACLLLEFWVKCTRYERLLPVKHFYLTCLLFFCCLKITLDSEQPMLKEKRIIPSVWGGIKGFEHFLRGKYFSDCASD